MVSLTKKWPCNTVNGLDQEQQHIHEWGLGIESLQYRIKQKFCCSVLFLLSFKCGKAILYITIYQMYSYNGTDLIIHRFVDVHRKPLPLYWNTSKCWLDNTSRVLQFN